MLSKGPIGGKNQKFCFFKIYFPLISALVRKYIGLVLILNVSGSQFPVGMQLHGLIQYLIFMFHSYFFILQQTTHSLMKHTS
jgi:hypothetical protein